MGETTKDSAAVLGSWRDYRLMVLDRLDRIDGHIVRLDDAVKAGDIKMAEMIGRASAWGAIAGIVGGVIAGVIVGIVLKVMGAS